ncbi:MAG: phosphatase PAP2 family protein [Rubrivivax sp.]
MFVGLLVSWRGGGIAGTARWPEQQAVFLAWNSSFAALPSVLWSGITLLGDSSVLLSLLALFLLGRPRVWAALLASVPAGGLLSISMKHWAGVPRPAGVLDPGWFNLIGPALQHNSFPSGHSISAFAAAAAVLATCVARPRRGRDWALIACGLLAATLIALSRVAVGAHWPLDLAAGAAIGWLAGLSGAALARRSGWWLWLFFGAGRRAAGTGLILWGLLLWLRPHETLACAAVLGVAGLCAVGTGFRLFLADGIRRDLALSAHD